MRRRFGDSDLLSHSCWFTKPHFFCAFFKFSLISSPMSKENDGDGRSLIAQAYHKLLRTSSPQTLLLPSSALHKHALNHLATLSTSHSTLVKLHQVLDICFGEQDTRWIEYQFEEGRMVGAKLLFLHNHGFTGIL